MNESPRSAGRWLRNLLILLLVGLAVHLILPQIATLEHSLQVIQDMTWWAVDLAAGAQAVSYLGSGVLLQAIAAMTADRLSVAQQPSCGARAIAPSSPTWQHE